MKVSELFQERKMPGTPYVHKIASLPGGITIWAVDGNYVRRHMEIDFTNFGQHYAWPKLIPKNEFWIDKEQSENELKYFVAHLKTEYDLMKRGASYETALRKAEEVEDNMRMARYTPKEITQHKVNPKMVHKKLWMKASNGVEIWIVDGRKVRDFYYTDFTEGGHEFVYDWVPPMEVWMDDDLSMKEFKFVLLHELHERNLMAKGMDYIPAHQRSLKIELECRKNPELTDRYLAAEGLNIAGKKAKINLDFRGLMYTTAA